MIAAATTAEESVPDPATTEPAPALATVFFGNATCPVSGEPVEQDKFVVVGNERVYVCCNQCKKKVTQDPEKYAAKAYPADAVTDVENEFCPIKGGAADAEVTTVWQGHRILFCCAPCIQKFLAQPNRKMAQLEDAALVELGNEHCIVHSDAAVVPDTFLTYADRIIGLCSADCLKDFAENPKGLLSAYEATHKQAPKNEVKPDEKDQDDGESGDGDGDEDAEGDMDR